MIGIFNIRIALSDNQYRRLRALHRKAQNYPPMAGKDEAELLRFVIESCNINSKFEVMDQLLDRSIELYKTLEEQG